MTDAADFRIAARYSGAILAIAADSGQESAVLEDLRALAGAVQTAPVQKLIHDPKLSRRQRAEAMLAVAHHYGMKAPTQKLVAILAENGRLSALPLLAEDYARRLRETRGELVAQVRSAAPLTPAQEKELKNSLENATGKKVALEASVDPKLLGGLVVTVDGRTLDASVAGKLARLKRQLGAPARAA